MTHWSFKGEAGWMVVLYLAIPLLGLIAAVAAPWVTRALGW